jgi:V8-like Glu-specific endopeptidase
MSLSGGGFVVVVTHALYIFIALIYLVLHSLFTYAEDFTSFFPKSFDSSVIYGEDNRRDFSEVSEEWKTLTKSVAVMIEGDDLIPSTSAEGFLVVKDSGVGEVLCADEKFKHQIIAGVCTGFLVAPDTLVTAGHCYRDSYDRCGDAKWVFEFHDQNLLESQSRPEQNLWQISKNNVYSCKKILKKEHKSGGIDYAIVQLDRPVTSAAPLKYRKTGIIADDAELVLIGSPTGLPLKISENGFIRYNAHGIFFKTNLDSFHGNSGAPVFNKETKEVEGILVRGEQDFVKDEAGQCMRPKKCAMTECRGEDAVRITTLDLK